MYKIKWSSKFKKEYKKFQFNKKLTIDIDNIIIKLAKGENLEARYYDHALQWQYKWLRVFFTSLTDKYRFLYWVMKFQEWFYWWIFCFRYLYIYC